MYQPGLVWRDATDYHATAPPKVPWIVEGFCAVGAVTVLVGDPGIGKLQAMSSEILTPTGWTTFRQIRIGDEIIGADGLTHRVTGKHPQGKKELYRVGFSDGTSTLAGEDHLWAVKGNNDVRRGRSWRVKRTADLFPLREPGGKRRWRVPIVEPVRFVPGPSLPLDPYLLGVLLGDGGLTQAPPSISSADPFIIEECQRVCPETIRSVPSSRYGWSIVGGAVRRELEALDLWGRRSTDKHIPSIYLFASVEDRLSLLQGLMDTDGYLQVAGTTAEIAVSCDQLATDIVHLVQSLGGTARRSIKKTTHLDSHRVTVALPPWVVPFRLPRKAAKYRPRVKYPIRRMIDSIEFSHAEEACCISVSAPDNLYVTNDFIVTHNSYLALTMAAAASHGLPVLGLNTTISEIAYLDAENGEGEMHRRICALGLRSNAKVAVAPGGFDLTASMYQVEDAVSPVTVRLLILDSFRSLMPNVDENSSQEVSEALVPIQHLARQYGVAVVLLHHRSKAGSLRGSTAFQSTAEIVVHLVKGKHGEELSLVWEKSRMGRKPRRRDLVLTEQGAVET